MSMKAGVWNDYCILSCNSVDVIVFSAYEPYGDGTKNIQ